MALTPSEILIEVHHDGSAHIGAANLVADDVAVDGVVILHRLLHVLGTLQVGRALVQVVVGDGDGALNLPAGVEQRVGDIGIVVKDGLCLHILVLVVLGGTGGGRGIAAPVSGAVVLRLALAGAVVLLLALAGAVVLLLALAGAVVLRHRQGVARHHTDDEPHNHKYYCPCIASHLRD